MFLVSHIPTRAVLLLLFTAALLLPAISAGEAHAQGNRRPTEAQRRKNEARKIASQRSKIAAAIKKADGQLASAKAAFDRAEYTASLGYARAASASFRVDGAMQGIEDAALQAELATVRLQSIEAEIEAAEGEDSELAQAEAAFEAARAALEKARNRVLASSSYQAAYKLALASSNKAELLPKARREALEKDKEFQEALREYELTDYLLKRERIRLYQASAEWRQTYEAARDSRFEKAEARDDLRGGLTHQLAGRVTARQADAAKARAASVIARNESLRNSLQRQYESLGKRKERLDSYGRSPGSSNK